MKLFLDDVRATPEGFDRRAWTAYEAIDLLKTGEVDFISFDHDLGEPGAGTGHDVALWIEREAYTNPKFVIPQWTIHSANPVGAKNIDDTMNSACRAWRP